MCRMLPIRIHINTQEKKTRRLSVHVMGDFCSLHSFISSIFSTLNMNFFNKGGGEQ